MVAYSSTWLAINGKDKSHHLYCLYSKAHADDIAMTITANKSAIWPCWCKWRVKWLHTTHTHQSLSISDCMSATDAQMTSWHCSVETELQANDIFLPQTVSRIACAVAKNTTSNSNNVWNAASNGRQHPNKDKVHCKRHLVSKCSRNKQ